MKHFINHDVHLKEIKFNFAANSNRGALSANRQN